MTCSAAVPVAWRHFKRPSRPPDTMLADSLILEPLAQFGLAGFMGAMWLWERHTSRKREEQIDEAHARIIGDRVQIDELISVVRANAEAMTRLATTQEQLVAGLRKEASR